MLPKLQWIPVIFGIHFNTDYLHYYTSTEQPSLPISTTLTSQQTKPVVRIPRLTFLKGELLPSAESQCSTPLKNSPLHYQQSEC